MSQRMGGRLILFRHGETSLNERDILIGWGDPPLTPASLSLLQSEGFKRRVNELAIKQDRCIFCSDLKRAVQTSEQISRLLVVPNKKLKSFRERNFGELSGITSQQAKLIFPRFDDMRVEWNVSPPRGEDSARLFRRVSRALMRIDRAVPPRADIVVTTHSDPIALLLSLLLHNDLRDAGRIKPDYCEPQCVQRERIRDLNKIASSSWIVSHNKFGLKD
jgi:broad specificity phosphatase PhoE